MLHFAFEPFVELCGNNASVLVTNSLKNYIGVLIFNTYFLIVCLLNV